MKIEITYTYQPSKTCPVIVSWTYVDTPLKDPEKAIKKAKTHFKTFQKEMGWTKSTKIKSIRLMFEHEETITDPAADPAPKPAAKRSTGTRRAPSPRKASSPANVTSRNRSASRTRAKKP